MCCNSKSPLVVLEDDVLADNWHLKLQKIHPDAGMMLLGWNLDSMLRAELKPKARDDQPI